MRPSTAIGTGNLPILGPHIIAPARPDIPPVRWTTPEPAKSVNPF